MLELSKIRFYLPIGIITALFIFFIADEKMTIPFFVISAGIYFLLGLFLGWRVECKIFLASFWMLVPITLFVVYLHFFGSSMIIKYIYAIAVTTFFIGFLISKFWNSDYRLIKMGLSLLLLGSIYGYYMIYILILS